MLELSKKPFLTEKETKQLIEYLDVLDDEYYNTDKQTVSDEVYDAIKEKVVRRKIGAPSKASVKLPVHLGSLDKTKTPEKWLKSKGDEFVITSKIDGVSCLVEVKNDKLTMYTRGDGTYGKDISVYNKLLGSLGSSFPFFIRGELVMKKEAFSRYKDKFANARAMLIGLINSRTVNDLVNFVAYEYFEPEKTSKSQSEQLAILISLGLKVPLNKRVKIVSKEYLESMLIDWKSTSEYEMDGLVITHDAPHERNTSDNPDYSIAFKILLEDSIAVATVDDVEWNISKRGIWKPRVKIHPINVSGITINYLSGFNGKYIKENGIGKGAILKITRSGDVIPYIIGTIKQVEPSLPKRYVWDTNHVEVLSMDESSPEKTQALITHFFKTIGVENVSDKTVEKLYNAGKITIRSILDSTDFMYIQGFAKTSSDKLVESIKKSIKELKESNALPTLLDAHSVFERGIGTRKLEELFKEYPNILDEAKKNNRNEIRKRILALKGFSDKTSDAIMNGLDKAIEVVEEFGLIASRTTSIASNRSIVFSGFRDKVLEKRILELGGKVSTYVSKNTYRLVCKDINASSSKIQTARDLGIPIITFEEFELNFN